MADQMRAVADLRHLVHDFVTYEARWRRGLRLTMGAFRERPWNAFLFGGLLRDLLTGGKSVRPRDVDIVVHGPSNEQLAVAFDTFIQRRTRFGGLNLRVRDWRFDVWGLETTWAFREAFVSGREFADLPRTTFLDVEAIAVELFPRPGKARKIYERNFFRAMARRSIEINLEENPYPILNVVRAMQTAVKFDFSLGPRLTSYILHHTQSVDLLELIDVQRAHYGYVLFSEDVLARFLGALREQHSVSRSGLAYLPAERWTQIWLPLLLHQRSRTIDALETYEDRVPTPGAALDRRHITDVDQIELGLPESGPGTAAE